MLSELIYSVQTHFIFELLQNAEDAIRQRGPHWKGSRTIEFHLSHNQLRISHFGVPFNEKDVQAICSVGESTKDDLTDIGHFGMGFKSVYKYTERPAIHSGSGETAVAIAINDYIYPEEISPIDRGEEETVFILPFKYGEEEASYKEITDGLYGFEVRNLLFLHEIDTIQWTVEDGISGLYHRKSEYLNDFIRRVTLTDQWDDTEQLNEEWLVFSRSVSSANNHASSNLEMAFKVDPDTRAIKRLNQSPLIVYFATNEETGLGFLVQGPYQTTLNRESIPSTEWNELLVNETSQLIRYALCWMRDEGDLNVDVLNCLPLLEYEIEDSRFESYYIAIKTLLKSEKLLPTINAEYISADEALLAGTKGVRDLLSIEQVSILYDIDNPAWLDDKITQDRTQDLYDYLVHELEVSQITPRELIRRLDQNFLENQSEEWIIKLYEFLDTHRGLESLYRSSPIIRLNSGEHITPDEEPFLPSPYRIDFPTIHPHICNDRTIRFLKHLGLRKPDLVDDVAQHVLLKYDERADNGIDWSEYANDIERIIRAYDTGSQESKARLIAHLRQTALVATVDASSGSQSFSRPASTYLATERLGILLKGIEGVRFLDTNQACLDSQTIQDILKQAGANECLKIIEGRDLSWEEKYSLRNQSNQTEELRVNNYTIDKLDEILETFSDCTPEQARLISQALWEELIHLRRLYGEDVFRGQYHWFYYTERQMPFEAEFLETLNNKLWIPNGQGELKLPSSILFAELGWCEDPFLQSKILFKTPSEVEQLAEIIGIAPDMIDEFKRQCERRGITNISELRRIMGDPEESSDDHQHNKETVLDSSDDNSSPFAELIIRQQALGPSVSSPKPVSRTAEGTRTRDSAVSDTQRSAQSGREGRTVSKTTQQYELTGEAKEQKSTFRDMVKNDYQGRCQICGNFFLTRKRKRDQTFITHIVPPSKDFRTNHFGNMLGLCGWHYALMKYGQRDLLHPKTKEPIDTSEILEQVSYNLEKVIEEDGQAYMSLPIRFYKVYPQWQEEAESIDEEIRLSEPHWRYLCELLKGPVGNDE